MTQVKIFKGRIALNGWQDLEEEMNQWIADNTAFISNIIDIRVNSNHSAAGNFLLGYVIYEKLDSLTKDATTEMIQEKLSSIFPSFYMNPVQVTNVDSLGRNG